MTQQYFKSTLTNCIVGEELVNGIPSEKCKVLRITNKRKPINAAYKIHNEELEIVNNAKYLGVTINKHLSLSLIHI